jgi:hypothetical protein
MLSWVMLSPLSPRISCWFRSSSLLLCLLRCLAVIWVGAASAASTAGSASAAWDAISGELSHSAELLLPLACSCACLKQDWRLTLCHLRSMPNVRPWSHKPFLSGVPSAETSAAAAFATLILDSAASG